MLLTEILERKKQYLEMMINNSEAFLKHVDTHLKYAYETSEHKIPDDVRYLIKYLLETMDKFYGARH